jgi:hypothetical protein
VPTDDACQPIDRDQFEPVFPVPSMEEMTIKCSEAGCGLEWPWDGGAAIIFSGEHRQIFVGGMEGLGKKLQFAAGRSNTIAPPGPPPF